MDSFIFKSFDWPLTQMLYIVEYSIVIIIKDNSNKPCEFTQVFIHIEKIIFGKPH